MKVEIFEVARICIICISMRAGGTERVIARLANFFCKKHQVDIVIVNNKDSFYTLDERVTLHRLSGNRLSSLRSLRVIPMLWHINRSVFNLQPDVILSFGELISPPARLVTLGSAAKFYVLNRASPISSLQNLAGIINPVVYTLADLVVTQTDQARKLLESRYRLSSFRVISNPIEVPALIRQISERANTITTVGYLGGRKNQQALLRAFAGSNSQNAWKLQIVGDGPERAALIEIANSLNITDQVEFLGERMDVPELLSSARIFAFTSLSEGFPNALAEALAHGCACISFDCITGPSELIQHNVNGLLIEAGNQEMFSTELDRLMADEALQERLSIAARREIERFSADRVLPQFEQLVLPVDPHAEKRQPAP